MRKILPWLICIVMAIGANLAGCGKQQPVEGSQVQNPPNDLPSQASSPQSQSPESRVVMAPPTDGDSAAVKPLDRQPPAPPAATGSAIPIAPQGDQVPTDPKVAEFAGLRAPKPATWIWRPSSATSKSAGSIAQYAVPGREGFDQAHITVFRLPGTLESNLTRWKGQFKSPDDQPIEPKVEHFEVDGMPVDLVEFAGQYKGAGATSFVPDQLFITAIVQAPAGQLFVRFVGPTGTVEPNREPFMNMIRNLRQVEPEK